MINEEKKIIEVFGKKRPFEVPKGYFDSLSEQVMSKIPMPEMETFAEPKGRFSGVPHKVVDLRFWHHQTLRRMAAAAIGVAVLLGGGVLFGLHRSNQPSGQMAQTHKTSTESSNAGYNEEVTFDQVADYAMMDSQDFYAQLVAEN